MKAQPLRLSEFHGDMPCSPEDATHIRMRLPGPLPDRIIPVQQHGRREHTGNWTWNGSVESPTVKPSVRTTGGYDRDGQYTECVCHSWIADGKVQFLTDSTHELAGQTLDLLEVAGGLDVEAVPDWQDAPDTENMVCRKILGTIELGIRPVLYGFRLVAGQTGSPCCRIDWCCGDSPGTHGWAYGFLQHILRCRVQEPDPWDGIPETSAIKPIVRDAEFLAVLQGPRIQYGRPVSVVLPDLATIRRRSMDQITFSGGSQ